MSSLPPFSVQQKYGVFLPDICAPDFQLLKIYQPWLNQPPSYDVLQIGPELFAFCLVTLPTGQVIFRDPV